MEPTVSVDYEELEKLCEQASWEPWAAVHFPGRSGHAPTVEIVDARQRTVVKWPGFDGCDQPKSKWVVNARLMAASRSAVPALLSERRKLHRALELATEALRCRYLVNCPQPGEPLCDACAAREAVRKEME